MNSDGAREAGRRAVADVRRGMAARVAELLRRDPERLDRAMELGLVSREWVDNPEDAQLTNATPLEVVQRYLERSVEEEPSLLASLGLTAVQALASGRDGDTPAETSQRLAVVFTDLEGFTRFTAEQGDDAATELLAEHRRRITPIIRGRGGRIVKHLGDGVLVTFLAPEAAVLACVELLERQPDPLRLRAGVHLGDVVLTHNDVVGHTVNVAARVTESARGGQVLASVDVRDAVGDDLPGVSFGRARRRTFKGLPEPVSVCPVTRAG